MTSDQPDKVNPDEVNPDSASQDDSASPAEGLSQTEAAAPATPPSSLGRLLRVVAATVFLGAILFGAIIFVQYYGLDAIFGGKMGAAERQALTDIQKLNPRRAEHFDKDIEKPIWDIDLNTTDVTDDDIEPLRHFGRLEILNLHDTAIGDAGLAHMSGLTKLTFLHLGNTKVTDNGLKHLRRMTRLHSLYLLDTALTDAGLEHLEPLKGLQILRVDNTAITDDGLVHFIALPDIKTLILSGTKITDAGLKHLEKIPSLRLVLAHGTGVTEEGATRLQEKVEGLSVEFE